MPVARPIKKYQKNRWAKNSKAEKWGVDKRRAKPAKRDLMIIGSGRSGTDFSARLFQKLGYDLRHETTGVFGTSTHFFHTDHHWYPYLPWTRDAAHIGERLSDYEFENVVHIVRNPLTCIPSIAKVFATIDWEFAEDTGLIPIGKMSKLERVMHYWVGVNERITDEFDICYRINLEKYERQFPALMNILGLAGSWPKDIKPSNRGTGYKASRATTYEALSQVNLQLAQRVYDLAEEYGYE